MKRGGFILLLGLVLGAAAFCLFYFAGTAASRDIMKEPQPELAWLKKEFNLGDEEFSRVLKLHDAYLPQCAERCKKIAEQNRKLQELLGNSLNVTPEVQELLLERAKTRAACETEMLNHFVQVSRTMPPSQGRRYLAWVEQQTFLTSQGMEQRHHAEADGGSDHSDHSLHHH